MKLARVGGVLGFVRRVGVRRVFTATIAGVLALGSAAGLLLYAARDGARAQVWAAYYTSTYSPSDLPGLRLSVQSNLVSPTSADLATVYGSPASPTATAPSTRITTLARALESDPDRIYQFVRNTILFEPQFGLHKGADGVLLDGSGGAFDQSQLMVELLRASGYQARFVLGSVNLTGADAKSILRVETGRQACILLATAGTPASINGGTTSCASLTASLTDVQMLHVWVEAQIGGIWYAFDPSLKTNNKITGVNLWQAAGTTAAAAWTNVASGVAVSGGNVNGVSAPNIQADVAGYATALQNNLIANHSEKSLRELAGGWEIVRTEAQLRNTTLPTQGSVSTRWTGGVPASYRATLRVQTAGFDHTFDLPSIYGWRTQAQIQGRVLKVAVRSQEHVDAAATAYFASTPCNGVTLICGSDPGQSAFDVQARRLDLTINHPYAARRTGNPTPALGTFGDELVAKSIEIGKRVDILVRTAGGNGGRGAAWAAANDPIQQHRLIPAGDDYNNCVAMDDGTAVQAGECDGQNAEDWRYWVQDSPHGNGPFAYGEVAVAEMGTKKDGLLNTWTDLFDKTVGILEPLSGARIFHQHSIGVALTPSYTENVLDIDTSVGIAANGNDQPHHILSALASLALTEEALAIGQSATQRPMFQGSPVQATAARRMAIGTGLKVLTAPGATTSLPADVSADTRARIELYLNKGFSVVATTAGTANAFLARRNDGSEQAWIMRSQTSGQAPDVDPRTAFRKGAATETPNPIDYLGKAESRRIAANVAGSLLGAVDLRMGTLSFSEGTELSIGQGEFPYSLSFSRSYVSTGPVEGDSGLGMGWTHNWESSVSHSTDAGALLPDAETVSAAPMLIAAMIALEAGRADTLQASVVSGIALDWLQEQVAANVVNVNGGGQSGRFVRLVDGTWRNPASPTESIAPATEPFIGAYTREINWTLADRSVMAFRDVINPDPSPLSQDRGGVVTSWTFPTGVIVTLTYNGGTATNRPSLASVSNNLGATLTFTHTQTPTQTQTQNCNTQASQQYPDFQPGYREAVQACHEAAMSGGRLTKVQAGPDEITFGQTQTCFQYVNFCAFQLTSAARPGLRTRTYAYGTPTGALSTAYSPMDYQQVLTQVNDAGVATARARFDWRATGGQVAPYVAEAFDAQDRKTIYYSSTFTYSSARDATNAVIRQTYDDDGRLATSADAMGRTSRATYDGPGRSETIQTPYGDVTAFEYDLRGNLIERTQTPIAGCATGLTTEQQAWWCQTLTIKAQYHATWNKPTRITLPPTAADPVERHWDLTYNVKGLVDTMTGPSVTNGLTGSNAQPVWRTWYDAYGRVNRTQDPTGVESAMTYGGGGLPAFCLRVQTVSSQSGGIAGLTTTQACDAVGNLTSVTDARGYTSTTAYDALRRKTSETGPAGTAIQTQFVYDLNGDQTQTKQWDSTAAVWRTTTTTFSATHKPLTVTDPSNDVSRTCYDLVDRPVTVIDGERRATHTVYNAAGQPTEMHRFQRAAAGSCSISTELPPSAGFSETRWRRFGYNAAGLQTSETDARGNVTQQQYDGLGRPARTIYADTAQAWTAMDERGQAVFRRQRGGSRAAVFYDAVGRDFHVREFAEADKTYMFKGRNSRASYDLAGRPVWRDVSTQTTLTTTFDDALRRDVRNYGYDTAGRMTSEQWRPDGAASGAISFTTGYGYDAANNRTSITWPGAWTATYAYDAANRIQTVTFPGSGGSVTLTHDSLSRRTGINRPGAAADTSYTHEPDSDLASMSHAFVTGTGPGAVSFAYGHDAAGKTTTIGISQPAFEWMPTLAYARSYGTANVLNQVASEAGVAVVFNADGNMTTDGVNTYSWTYGNRMIGASRSGMTAAYDYDSDDRRTKKTVNGVVTRTLWSGADELAEYDGAGALVRRFVPDGTGAMDSRLATVTSAGAVYWHHVDHQGSVIATSNSAGQTVGTASYSPYGEFGTGTTTPPLHSPFGYTGRQHDVETGLYQYRARYYSPKLGQFLSMDPIGSKDDPNLYLYVANDPVNGTDPTGMCWTLSCLRLLQKTGEAIVNEVRNDPIGVTADVVMIAADVATVPSGEGLAGVALRRGAREVAEAGASRASTLRPGPYARESIPAQPGRPTSAQQREINRIGDRDGCHTCGSRESGRRSENWTGDHQPPNGRNSADQPQRFYPHCANCSARQGAEVRNANRPPPPPPQPRPPRRRPEE
ncbi:RHS repeat-associated core domain-containing protein [Brevundimonas sp. BR2-1]|uniref:RHS repeat-associated core domain-containing protein n=1 Tax=Brevundimonas sp. BR2-1 TaxID=3031123 RepID=UPI0030B02696